MSCLMNDETGMVTLHSKSELRKNALGSRLKQGQFTVDAIQHHNGGGVIVKNDGWKRM